MNIDKAIEILTIHNEHNPNYTDKEREEAHQLGIEALKRIITERPHLFTLRHPKLPRETED